LKQPLISIVTPSFNGVTYLRDMLASLSAQSYQNWEHIFVDNCSTDGTLDVLAEWGDPRRKLISESDSGQSNAINKGFKAARGDILCWLNVDDFYAGPQVLQSVVDALQGKGADVFYGRAKWRYEPEGAEKDVWIDKDASNVRERFQRHIGLCQPAVFWTRNVIDIVGLLDETLHYAMDFDLWCRIASQPLKWSFSEDYLAIHRVHPDMKTVRARGRSLIETLLTLRERFNSTPPVWIERLAAFYAEGAIGLQDNKNQARPALSDGEASLLRELIEQVFSSCDWQRFQLLLGQVATGAAAGSAAPHLRFLDDVVACRRAGNSFGVPRFRRMADRVWTFRQIPHWRKTIAQGQQSRISEGKAMSRLSEIAANPAAPPGPLSPPVAPTAVAPKSAVDYQYDKLLRLKNRFAGRECVLLCNGPSLRDVDFSKLQSRYLIGLNKIYLGTDLIGREPDMLVCVNKKVLEQSVDKFKEMTSLKLLGSRAGMVVEPGPRTFYFNSSDPKAPRFSHDIVKNIHEGWTVTHAALQVAFYVGFRKVIIVGMDHHFPDAAGKPNEAQNMEVADRNHFSPNYFGFGQKWDLPDLENSEISYRAARAAYQADNRLIIDATEAGHCRIFERMTLADALKMSIPR
jgi:GT2 family glycosyltransferase